MRLTIRSGRPTDNIGAWVSRRWGDKTMAVHGRLYDIKELDGLVAVSQGSLVGVLTYVIEGDSFEIVSIDRRRP